MSSVQSRLTPINAFLVTGAFTLSIIAMMFAIGGSSSPCASAQSTQCSVGDTELITGELTLQDALLVESTPSAGTSGQVLASAGASTVPTWEDLGALGVPSIVGQAADLTDSGGAPYVATDLTFPVEASSEYAFTYFLRLASVGSNPSLALEITEPASAEWDCAYDWYQGGSSPQEHGVSFNSELTGVFSLNAPAVVVMDCAAEIAGTSGNIALGFHGNSTSYTIQEGSWVTYTKIG